MNVTKLTVNQKENEMSETITETAVVVRQLFRKPHETIANQMKDRVIDLLNGDLKLKRYAAGAEWNGDLEHLELELDEKTTIEIKLLVKR